MKKQIIITCCAECPFYEPEYNSGFSIYPICTHELGNMILVENLKEIDSDCPLEDVK